jgi:hypothetical protein
MVNVLIIDGSAIIPNAYSDIGLQLIQSRNTSDVRLAEQAFLCRPDGPRLPT